MGSYFSREFANGLTGPVKYMIENHGAENIKFVEKWVRLTLGDGPLRGWTLDKPSRTRKMKNLAQLAPLITVESDFVYKRWTRRELKAIVADFPKDVRKNKQKWLEKYPPCLI